MNRKKAKKSSSAIFMYIVIGITVGVSSVSFILYYANLIRSSIILWVGIVAFMIMYHFWLRIIMGNVTKLFKIDRNGFWFKERFFEKKLYRMLLIRKWKDKVLTYNPELFDMKSRTLDEIADTMTKAETDHWVNEVISVSSIFFSLVWGQFWIFLITAIAAMLFDLQFIIVQRYNRPIVLRVIERKNKKQTTKATV